MSLTGTLAKAWATRRIGGLQDDHPLEVLRSLMLRAADTRFGREFGFGEMARAADHYERFVERVPIIDYPAWRAWLGERGFDAAGEPKPLVDEAWPGKIDVFCMSSGTTSGRTKYVPYSREMAKINRRAALDFFAHALQAKPDAAPPGGRTLYMSGSTDIGRNDYGSLCGDMSGLTKYLAPKAISWMTLPPQHIAALEPWSTRLDALVELCRDNPKVSVISGIPIWQLTFLQTLVERTGKSVHENLPRLRCLIHGGMSMSPYRDQIVELVGPDVLLLETYAASELGIAAYQRPGEVGMRFWRHYDVFYEFENAAGEVLLFGELEIGVAYSLIISSCAGLWRYRLGDSVVFRSLDPPILDYVTRDKTTSAFDEKVTEKECEQAMSGVAPSFADFAMGPDLDGRRHQWFVIGETAPNPAWLEILDDNLRAQNMDYDDYRGDGRIKKPAVVAVPDRATFLAAIGREEGGQRKFPRLLSPDEVQLLVKTFGGA